MENPDHTIKILKFPLAITDRQEVEMPMHAQIISVQDQAGVLCLWALCDCAYEPWERTIEIIGTGNPTTDLSGDGFLGKPEVRKYIGTAQMHKGAVVWHVFEITDKDK